MDTAACEVIAILGHFIQRHEIIYDNRYLSQVRCVPVTTVWRVHRLRMEERPPAMEHGCEYIEKAIDRILIV
jgi:hypothetical protein